MAEKCTACKEDLPFDYVQCSTTNACKLHFGPCSGLLEVSWRKADKSTWKCPSCRKQAKQGPEPPHPDLKAFMSNVNRAMEAINLKLNTLSGLEQKIEELKNSIDFMSAKYDEIITRLNGVEEVSKTSKQEIETLKLEIKARDSAIDNLNLRLRDTEQYARNRNIEVSGIEMVREEDLVQVMGEIASKLGVPFSDEDIDVIHRIPSRREDRQPPRIIAQFTSRKKRNLFLKKKNLCPIHSNEVTNGSSNARVYLNSHLTPEWKNLLWQAKQVGRPNGYKIIWYQDFKICAKKDITDTRPIFITKESDIPKLNRA